jgi:hypothetical protein
VVAAVELVAVGRVVPTGLRARLAS